MVEALHRVLVTQAEQLLGGMSRYGRLKRLERASRDEVLKAQRNALEGLLLHAATHVPYYCSLLRDAAVVSPTGAVCVENLIHVPCLDKALLREHFEQLKSDDLASRVWFRSSSGGSTGEPTQFIQEKECKHWIRAIRMLFDDWSGCPIGAKQTFLWGSERDMFVGKETPKVKLKRFLKNEQWLNAFRMTPDSMRDYVQRINKFKPVQIQAYVTSVYELARFIEENRLDVYTPKCILTSAGTLYPHIRETIERVFHAPVFNRYGTREVGDIASQFRPNGGLLVVDATHYVEILRPDGTHAAPGEIGEVVVTYLVNKAMPLIRYRIGDLGAWAVAPDSKGPAWSAIEHISGRVTDPFLRRDGGIVTPEYLIHLVGVVLNKGWIRRYQVIQKEYDHVAVRIVLSDPVSSPEVAYADKLSEITSKMRLALGDTCAIEYSFEDDIPPTPSGKYRYTVSMLLERGERPFTPAATHKRQPYES